MGNSKKLSKIIIIVLLWSLFGEKSLQIFMPKSQKTERKLTYGIAHDSFGTQKELFSIEELRKKTLFKKQTELSELPNPFGNRQIDNLLHLTYAKQIQKKQDEIMSSWPVYTTTRDKLREELITELNFEKLTISELIQTAVKYREKFWQKGGCLSKISYEDVYKARLLLEYAYDNNPQNLKVIDELVETIQSANKIARYNKNRTRIYPNEEVKKKLLGLRSKQFLQIKKETTLGRRLTISDFKCGCDLAFLQQDQNKKAAKDTTEWLKDNAWLGGWTAYDKILEGNEKLLDKGVKTTLEIYFVPQDKPLDESRYSWRLPSFQGPKKRGAFLLKQDIEGKTVTDHTLSEFTKE